MLDKTTIDGTAIRNMHTGRMTAILCSGMRSLAQSILFACLLPVLQANAATTAAMTGSAPPPIAYPVMFSNAVIDLSVKVWGGSIVIQRGYLAGEWYSNLDWMPLKLTYDSIDNTVKTITRGRADYSKVAPGVFQDLHSNIVRQTATGFRWNDPHDNWIEYNPAGEIKAYGDRNGTIASFLYSGAPSTTTSGVPSSEGYITGILDHYGNQALWFDYDANGSLIRIRDAAGRKVEYQTTVPTLVGSSMSQTVVDADGNTWNYQIDNIYPPPLYGVVSGGSSSGSGGGGATLAVTVPAPPPDTACLRAAGTSITITDPAGHTTTRNWYPNGALALTRYADGSAICTNQDYDAAKQVFYDRDFGPFMLVDLTAGIPPGTKLVETWFGLNQDLTRGEYLRRDINGVTVEQQSMDTANRTNTITDARGLNTAVTRDQWYNITRTVYPDGSSVSDQYDPSFSNVTQHTDENGVVTQNTYDTHGNLLKTVEALGLAEQRSTEYTYDASGQRLTMTRKGDATTPDAVTQYAYDNNGNVVTVTDPEGGIMTYTYDVMGDPLTFTDQRGKVWKATYDARGKLLSLTDPLNRTTTIAYDKVGLPVSLTDAAGNVSTLSYDALGRKLRATDAYGAATAYTYDTAGNPVSLTDAANHTQRLAYDLDGRLTKYTDGNGNVIQLAFGDAASGLNRLLVQIAYPTFNQQFKFDNRDRLTQATNVLDASTSQISTGSYDAVGNLTKLTDAASRSTALAYNAFGDIIQDTNAAGGVTQYGHDTRGNLVSVKDAKGNTYQFAYDKLDRMVKEVRPLGQAITYAYDANGNLTQLTDAKGQVRQYVYDDANRRVQEKHFDAGGALVKTIAYTWNALNRLTGYNDGTTVGTYTYDARQLRRTGESVNYGSFTLTDSTTWNALGQRASLTYPDGAAYSYTYTGNNQISSVQMPNGSITWNSYDWLAPAQITLPGGTVRSLSYDPLLRPTAIDVKDPYQSSVMAYQYKNDLTNNIIAKATKSGSASYSYDSLNRLTAANYTAQTGTAQANESYGYDAVTNRVTGSTGSLQATVSYTYNENNQLTQAGTISYTYDANGNNISQTDSANAANSRNYVYDTDNRLIEVRDASNTLIAAYSYDPFGRRLSKDVGTQKTFFLYSEEGLIAEADASGVLTKSYGYAPGGSYTTKPLFMKSGATYYYYQNDHLGTPQKLVDQSGKVVWSATYEAYGNATVDPASTLVNNLRFPGQYYDAETGLNNNWMRYYDPATGRYVTSDPIGLIGGINMYAYVAGRPIVYSDPKGEWIVTSVIETVYEGYKAYQEKSKDPCATFLGLWGTVLFHASIGAATGFISPPGGPLIAAVWRSAAKGFVDNSAGQIVDILSYDRRLSSFDPWKAAKDAVFEGIVGGGSNELALRYGLRRLRKGAKNAKEIAYHFEEAAGLDANVARDLAMPEESKPGECNCK